MDVLIMTLLFLLRMASGTRARGQNPPESELPPPPTMAEVLQNIENNRQRSERFLKRLVQNTERRAEGVTLGDFIKAQIGRAHV